MHFTLKQYVNIECENYCIPFQTAAKIEWYPLSRDTFVYVISVSVLALILRDNHVHWYDGLLLVLLYGGYIVGMSASQICGVARIRSDPKMSDQLNRIGFL